MTRAVLLLPLDVYSDRDHQCAERVALVGNVEHVGVGQAEQLLADSRDGVARAVDNAVIPVEEIAGNRPTAHVEVERFREQAELALDRAIKLAADVDVVFGQQCEQPLLEPPELATRAVVYEKAVTERELSLDDEADVAVRELVAVGVGIVGQRIDVIAVEPREKALFEQ